MEIKFVKREVLKEKPQDTSKLGFGQIFSDYMFIMDWTAGEGWHDARIVPFDYIPMHPAATCLHYGSEIFEGLKAYRRADGKVQMFRPIENVRRMNASAVRMALPEMDEEMGVEIIKKYVEVEQDWVPHDEGTSLYLRPFMFGCDETLGVHAAKHVTFMLIASPSGSYYAAGLDPVKIMIEDEDVRAVRGGTGFTKCGGNYAGSIHAAVKAGKMGYEQVLWLDGVERKYIEEVGAMNVMFKINGEIVTPMLNGSILPGITRKSCIEVLKDEGYNINERLLSIDELLAAMENGTLEEAWGTGTAAVISPIGELMYKGKKYVINNNEIGEVSQHLYDELTGIQWGKVEDRFGWIVEI